MLKCCVIAECSEKTNFVSIYHHTGEQKLMLKIRIKLISDNN